MSNPSYTDATTVAEYPLHQQKEIHLIPLIPSYSLLKPLILRVRKE